MRCFCCGDLGSGGSRFFSRDFFKRTMTAFDRGCNGNMGGFYWGLSVLSGIG